ncbi:NADPH-dependent FMN reductase [Streptomyces sparsus]
MPETPIKLAVIIGSVRGGRFGPTVANWFVDQAEQHGGVTVDLIDLLDHQLPMIMPPFGEEPDAQTQAVYDGLQTRLADADAFVVVTPEYNHTTSPALKNTIDWYLDEWKAKPVGLISYGGMGGGLRAAEHLRQVFAEVHATTVRDMVSFHNAWDKFEHEGKAVCPQGSDGAAKSLLDQLVWWGNALRDARAKAPYTG